MGLIILLLVLTIVFGVIAYILRDASGVLCGIGFGSIVSAIITGFLTIILVAIVSIGHIAVDGSIAANKEIRESLVYQLENDLYENDNDIGKKELYNQVTAFNKDLAKGKAMKDNIWIGVFYPDKLYDTFDFIKLN